MTFSQKDLPIELNLPEIAGQRLHRLPFAIRILLENALRHSAQDAEAEDAVNAVSYTHLRAHETVLDLVCRLLHEKKKIPEA